MIDVNVSMTSKVTLHKSTEALSSGERCMDSGTKMTLEMCASQKARHPPAGLVQLSERMCKLSVRVMPWK